MRVESIEEIKAAGPLNVVWGAGCSSGSTGLNWPTISLAELWRLRRIARLLGKVLTPSYPAILSK